jgi:xanthine dehydrogenase accessory factor
MRSGPVPLKKYWKTEKNKMEFWDFIYRNLSATGNVILLYVLTSEGSSPGRKGFKMAIASTGEMHGTIGGGIMEQKIVTLAIELLIEKRKDVILKQQYHDKQHATGQSGMICSGSQLNAIIPLTDDSMNVIEEIINNHAEKKQMTIHLSEKGISVSQKEPEGYHLKSEQSWEYSEGLFRKPVLHIFGSGHIGLALSEVMSFTGFYVKLYDNRQGLNTFDQNIHADEKLIIDYENANEIIINENDFVVIMTIGYRTDKIVLKQLLLKKIFYLGLLGSSYKIEKLFSELKEEGFSEQLLNSINAPVGIHIASQTAQEIAISIAAEIIRKKNELKSDQ